jgi:hypothetical protein
MRSIRGHRGDRREANAQLYRGLQTSWRHVANLDGQQIDGVRWLMRMAEADPFYDPLEDALDDLAGEWGETEASEEEDRLVWGE